MYVLTANSGMESTPSVVVSHPDFRMIVLANRPGFPFLGNDFFAAMGKFFIIINLFQLDVAIIA